MCTYMTHIPWNFFHTILLSFRYLNAKAYYGGFNREELHTIFTNIHQKFPKWVQTFAPMAISVNNNEAIGHVC